MSESDGLPGITIDRYGDFLVMQLLSAGAEYQRVTTLLAALKHCYPDCALYDRSDFAVRKKGEAQRSAKKRAASSAGARAPTTPPDLLPIHEHDMALSVDIAQCHKTGFYLDQRDSLLYARKYAARAPGS